MISFIVAMDLNGVIGKNNKLPWYIPADLKRFKEITIGHTVVMGRKTFDSIKRPLSGRTNVILTGNKDYKLNGCVLFHDFDSLLKYCQSITDEVFIIGGSKVFELFKPYVERMYITRIYKEFYGDIYFPDVDWNKFELIKKEEGLDDTVTFKFEYLLYQKK